MKAQRTVLFLVFSLCSTTLFAEDWPQWRGPGRDNKSAEKNLLKKWPEGGPKLLWTFKEAGNGYSSFAVVGDRAYTMGTEDGSDTVMALDVKTGKQVWSTKIGGLYRNRWGDGPRGTPTVDGKNLYALGGGGDLVCLNVEDGKKVWSVNLKNDLNGRMMSGWGYSESVLVDGDHIICTPGGRDGTLAALDKKTGKKVWQGGGTDPAGYSSVVVGTLAGVRQYVQQTGAGAIGVNPKDGKLLWRHKGEGYRTAAIPTPVIHKDQVYITMGYGVGCYLLDIKPDGDGGLKAEKVYGNNVMETKHGGVILVDGYIYGHNDRNKWVCQAFDTGKEVWSESGKLGRRNRSGSLTYADGMLYLFTDRGVAGLIEASPEGWKEHGQFTIPEQSKIRSGRGGVWSHPVVANGRLYLRDQDLIFCYDVSAK